MLNNKIIKKISNDAVKLDWRAAFGGKSKGNRHLFRVNKIIIYLLKKEGGDYNIAVTGGWIHDVSLAWGSDHNRKNVEKYTKKFLEKYKGLDKKESEEIIKCAAFHENGGKSLSIEAKIVHDADVIDKSGILGIIRHIWKMTNMLENRVLVGKQDLCRLKRHLKEREIQVFTNTGKSLVKILNVQANLFFAQESNAKKVMNIISKKAYGGFTSDQIAKLLLKNDVSGIFAELGSQLDCSYLQ